jgi:hypothetical protein
VAVASVQRQTIEREFAFWEGHVPMIPLDHARRVMLCAVLLFAAAAGCAPNPNVPSATAGVVQTPSERGGLVAKNATIDLGPVPFNQQSDAIFELTNTSGQPIHLTGAPTVQMLEGC